ncbi:hypothetical protein C2E23DRAFT_808640 [Lenzites betulinus]|nr:hypothetical protein C2E23DRAFT_808640 [Lenzites betulinus]
MNMALRTLQTQYENETRDADAARGRTLCCFVQGRKFDLCIAWSFRDFFPAHYTGKDKQDEINSYRFFNFKDPKDVQDGTLDDSSASTPEGRAEARTGATATSLDHYPETQELLGEARDLAATMWTTFSTDNTPQLPSVQSGPAAVGDGSKARPGSPKPEVQSRTSTSKVQPQSSTLKVQPQSATPLHDLGSGSANELASPVVFIEYKADNADYKTCRNQARFNLVSALKYMAGRGIIGVPIFAVVAAGTVGHVISAWSEESGRRLVLKMLDTNCPQYNIADRTQALRFATFLVQICTQWTAEFNERELQAQKDLPNWWKTDAPRWRWKMSHQQEEPVFKNAVQALRTQAGREDLPGGQE